MNRQRRAYTFVEILVVIAIIGILIALMLPAVQAAREAARRMTCSQNLAQLIIAVQNYESHHHVYPPGTINDTRPIRTFPAGYHHNWIIQLLPYLEEKTTWTHIDRRLSVYDPANARVRKIKIPKFTCPSQAYVAPGFSDYAGAHNDVETPIDVDNNGVFFLNSHVGYFDLKDGSSHTIFIGEKITFDWDLGWMSGTRATLRNTGMRINPARRNATTPRTSPVDYEMGESFQSITNEESAVSLQAPGQKLELLVGGFGSFHPGGAQFALGDGSVQFLSETMDSKTYLRMANRADQKLIEQPW